MIDWIRLAQMVISLALLLTIVGWALANRAMRQAVRANTDAIASLTDMNARLHRRVIELEKRL